MESSDLEGSYDWHEARQRIKKPIGSVSQKVLTSQLRQMEESGVVSRKVYLEVLREAESLVRESESFLLYLYSINLC